MNKKKRFNYIRKKIARGTWFRIGVTVISFILLLYCIASSVLLEGKGPLYIGAIGMTSVVLALFSVFDMVPQKKDPERNYLPARIAGFTSGIIVFIWIFLIISGVILTKL